MFVCFCSVCKFEFPMLRMREPTYDLVLKFIGISFAVFTRARSGTNFLNLTYSYMYIYSPGGGSFWPPYPVFRR